MNRLFSATCEEELRSLLSATKPIVPPRHHGRKTEDAEKYALWLLFSNIDLSRMSFPLTIEKREKPDFVISSSISIIGIEHVEAVHPDTAKSDFLRGRRGLEEPHFITRRVWDRKSSNKKLSIEIENNSISDGWDGNSAEHEWCHALCDIIQNKISKSDGYVRFQENWLLIYDNLEIPPVKFKICAPFLAGKIKEIRAHSTFRSILVVDDHKILEFSAGAPPTRRDLLAE